MYIIIYLIISIIPISYQKNDNENTFIFENVNKTNENCGGLCHEEIINEHHNIYRTVANIMNHQLFREGAGVIVRRTIGIPPYDHFDPFLLLDEFKSDKPNEYIEGFPWHPHRGFETVTYMLEGIMEHKDNKGNSGILRPGSVQWMTAGKGIIHSEMPKQKDGKMWGFQLWVNLPSKYKLIEPRYQDIEPEDIPIFKNEDESIIIKVISGEYKGLKGPIKDIITNPIYFDVYMKPGNEFIYDIDRNEYQLFIYPFIGSGTFCNKVVKEGSIIFTNNDGNKIKVKSDQNEDVRFLMVGANPIKEPISRRGPFVMNTKEEIEKAFKDYREGRF